MLAVIVRIYNDWRGRAPRVLKEDFCGTALLAAAWAMRSPCNRATGVDIDAAVLEWGRHHNLVPRGPGVARRVTLVHGDVRVDHTAGSDVICALNCSCSLITTRAELVAYFINVRANLAPDGLFILDCMGGTDVLDDFEEHRDHGDFVYIWAQHGFNPLDHSAECSISFAFPDGSRLDKAFAYRWRVWTVPELRDCLAEAGFSQVRTYWDHGTNSPDLGISETTRAHTQELWLAYVVASL